MTDELPHLSRRGFLVASGAAALGSSLTSAAWAAPESGAEPDEEGSTMDQQVRIGVVGGGFGASFQWHLDPDCVVAAVSDLRPDRREHLRNTYGCGTAYGSLEDLIRDDSLDAVAVFSGAPDHVRHCVAAMNRGKHCISAVPAAMTLEECEELIEAKERNGVFYMMAETSYYRSATITARRLYEDGKFGNILYSEVEYYHPLTDAEREALWFYGGRRTWRYGYPPMLYPTHSTGFLVGVTRERLIEVSCLGHGSDEPALKDNAYNNPFSSESALFKTDQGNICRCNMMMGVWAHGERATWFGQNLSLFMETSGGQPYVLKQAGQPDIMTEPDHTHTLPESMRVESGHGGSHSYITHEFVRAIVEDREPSVNVYEAVAMTAPGIVAHQSSLRGGEQLRVPSFDRA